MDATLNSEQKQLALDLAKKMLKVARHENPIIVCNAALMIIQLTEHIVLAKEAKK